MIFFILILPTFDNKIIIFSVLVFFCGFPFVPFWLYYAII